MNNTKTDGTKPSDHEDGDHAQPINLVAPRPPTPASTIVTTFPGLTVQQTPNQPVTLRPHAESSKPGLMTLYFRTPATTARPSGPSHIINPVMGAQVASSQHFANKQAIKGFKSMRVGYYQDKTEKSGNEFNIKVIRMPPNDNSQNQNNANSTMLPSAGILPNVLAGNNTRHTVPVHPGLGPSAGCATATPMASIIKSGHPVSQVTHAIHQPFSSHVPRGPAAVANISAGPRSGVATPIIRAPHSSGTMTLASSMISPNAHVRVRSQALPTGRTSSCATYAQVIDFQKNPLGHTLVTNPTQTAQPPRSLDIPSTLRAGIPHPSSSITIGKQINISQPIVQHLQQVAEKGCLKTISGITTTTTASSNSTPAHQNATLLATGHATAGEVHSVCIVPTITRATMSSSGSYTTGIVQFPGNSITQHVPLRPSLVQPQGMASNLNIAGPQGNSAYAVISTKTLPSGNQPLTIAAPANRTAVCSAIVIPSSSTVVTSTSVLPSTTARVLNSPMTGAPAIPIAKVYPQPLAAVVTTSTSAFVTQTTNLNTFNTLKTAVSSTTATTTTTTVSTVLHPPSVVKRGDSTSVRFTSLTKPPASGTSFAVPPGSYLYDSTPNALAVHPYNIASSNQGFSNALNASHIQTFALSQHGNANLSSTAHPVSSTSSTIQPLNSLMVAVDSRHVAIPYNRMTIGAGKTVAELVTPPTTVAHNLSASANLVALSQASATHGTTHGTYGTNQGTNAQNHLSPRPSILRKRTAESPGNSVAKRNLMTSLGPDPGSPSSDVATAVATASSPKPLNGVMRENGMPPKAEDSSRLVLPCPVIKKEPGVMDDISTNEEVCPETRIETSPRKKPRKQLLAANERIETHLSEEEEHFHVKAKPEIKNDEDSSKWVTFAKRPVMSLLTNYRHIWKTRYNHFTKYTDVKPKDEKVPSINELANQKGIMDEISGWKIHHFSGQMESLNQCESSVYTRLSKWLDLEKKSSGKLGHASLVSEDAKILNKLTDLVKGNLQRSKIAQEQATESQTQMLKMLDHKQKVADILGKYTNRRQSKKKERL